MKRESMQRSVVRWLVALLVMAFWTTSWTAAGTAQETPPPAPEAGATPAATAPAEAAPTKKSRGRLPAYYGKVVTDKQREDIYSIQAKFNEQIAKLQEQLAELTTQRDTDVEKVLTDDQRAEIARLKNERKARNGEPATSEPPANGG
jgi:hypothetical protein